MNALGPFLKHSAPRRLDGWPGFLVRSAVAAAVGVIAGVGNVLLADWTHPLALAATVLLNLVVMGGAVLIGIWWWRDIDEAAREAHKWAWWWGGSVGLAAGGVIYLTGVSRGFGSSDLGDGVVLMLGAQLLGYAIAWGVWWLQRR